MGRMLNLRKSLADRRRQEVHFEEGGWVYMKLQPFS
ncbi:hypothetical protein V6Z12_D09G016100 [Gossypium hirsutum]